MAPSDASGGKLVNARASLPVRHVFARVRAGFEEGHQIGSQAGKEQISNSQHHPVRMVIGQQIHLQGGSRHHPFGGAGVGISWKVGHPFRNISSSIYTPTHTLNEDPTKDQEEHRHLEGPPPFAIGTKCHVA